MSEMINLILTAMKTTTTILAIILGIQFQVWAQTSPQALNVKILGEALYNGSATTKGSYTTGTVLTGSYEFSDADGNAEGTSTFKWYRDGLAIAGATSVRYTVQSADVSKNIAFEITPIDNTSQSGSAVATSSIPASVCTYNNAGTNNLSYPSGTNNVLNMVLADNRSLTVDGNSTVLTIHGDLEGTNKMNVSVTNGAKLIVNGQFITNNKVVVNVDATSSFTIESGLDAKNNSDLTILGEMIVNADIYVENNAVFNVGTDGLFAVLGNVDFGNNGSLTVDGLMTVGGDLTGEATISGEGSIDVSGTVAPTITDGNNVLPIELTYFRVYNNENTITLKWETATEINNDFFTIERSEDGVNFYAIATLDGAGNSYSTIAYSSLDNNPVNGINYYRLKQTDYNGAFSYSNLQSVNVKRYTIKEIKEVSIYPNPIASPNFILTLDIPGEYYNESALIKVFNFSGQEIIEYEVSLEGAFNKTAIDISNMITGNYIILVLTSSNSFKNKLVVL